MKMKNYKNYLILHFDEDFPDKSDIFSNDKTACDYEEEEPSYHLGKLSNTDFMDLRQILCL